MLTCCYAFGECWDLSELAKVAAVYLSFYSGSEKPSCLSAFKKCFFLLASSNTSTLRWSALEDLLFSRGWTASIGWFSMSVVSDTKLTHMFSRRSRRQDYPGERLSARLLRRHFWETIAKSCNEFRSAVHQDHLPIASCSGPFQGVFQGAFREFFLRCTQCEKFKALTYC